ncbi:MAG: energy-coupling factor transporter ATPase [Aerococcus sp.]|nr:energy-coupling factor transporter ATPase [Aerococcus sp.]
MQIQFHQVGFHYGFGTPFEQEALKDVNFTIPDQKFTALIGQTGSGKSTAVKHLVALLKPTSGKVVIGDWTLTSETNGQTLRDIRSHVGIVFQFPESQLFEETVLKDVMFGPKNYGATEEEATDMAKQALKQVGISEELFTRAPFDLSGGQMRRVAIAGVLAMKPELLILDEPTAGLDPKGRQEMMDMFYRLYQEQQLTVVLVTHQMNDVAEYADHVVVMEQHTAIKEGSPEEIFEDEQWLDAHHLGLPDTVSFAKELAKRGVIDLPKRPWRFEAFADALAEALESGGENG